MTPSTQTEYLLSSKEVRQLLGLGRTYTYQLLATGAIPSVRIGRLRKVRRVDLELARIGSLHFILVGSPSD
jgi:excisionase family DNA binding protein